MPLNNLKCANLNAIQIVVAITRYLPTKVSVASRNFRAAPTTSPYILIAAPILHIGESLEELFFNCEPIKRVGRPVNASKYMNNTLIILVEPNNMKFDAIAPFQIDFVVKCKINDSLGPREHF